MKPYIAPEIDGILLDKAISLQLTSDAQPEGEPNWAHNVDQQPTDPIQHNTV